MIGLKTCVYILTWVGFLHQVPGHLQGSPDLAGLYTCAKFTTNRPQLKRQLESSSTLEALTYRHRTMYETHCY